jgi:hypothetical protein
MFNMADVGDPLASFSTKPWPCGDGNLGVFVPMLKLDRGRADSSLAHRNSEP